MTRARNGKAIAALARHPKAEQQLSPRWYQVLRLRAEGLTLREVGLAIAHWNRGWTLTGSRIREIEHQAIYKLDLIAEMHRFDNSPEGFYRLERWGDRR